MSTTLAPETATSGAAIRRSTWALWGTAAGVGGVVANLMFSPNIGDDLRRTGTPEQVLEHLNQTSYYISAIAGFLSIVALLFFAAGLARWGRAQGSDSLVLRVAPLGVLASAGALIVAYGVKQQLASYLEGGFNEKSYGDSARYFYFLLDDLMGYYSWWGVTVAIACLSYLAFRERLVPRWLGAFGALVVAIPVLMLFAFGFAGLSGVVSPVFLVVAGITMSRQRA